MGAVFHFFPFEPNDLWLTIKLIVLLAVETGERFHQRQTREEKKKENANATRFTESKSRWNLLEIGRREKWFIIWFGFVLSMLANGESRTNTAPNSITHEIYQITLVGSRGHSQGIHTKYSLDCSIFIAKANICLSITSAKDVCEITKCSRTTVSASSPSFFVRVSDEINHLK